MPYRYEFFPPLDPDQLQERLNELPTDTEVVAFAIDVSGKYVALIRYPAKAEPEEFTEDRFVDDGGL